MAAGNAVNSAHVEDTRGGIRVLIVDDNATLRRQMASLLSMEKDLLVIGTAANSRQAVEAARKQPLDVVLMDIRMPGGSGIESAKAIKALRADVAVIALTMLDTPEARRAATEAGMVDYLVKGVSFQKILRSIRRSVRRDQA